MEFTQASFEFLLIRNSELESQAKSDKEFSQISWLNESQSISQVGSWKWNLETGLVEWSDMMYLMLGLLPNQESPSYELALEHVHEEDKSNYESALAEAIENKENYYFENRIVKNDKSVINVISRGKCILNDKKELIRMAGTVQDVTYLKKVLTTSHQLEQFANILSHDFKSPIRTIISFVDLIKRKSFDNLTEQGKQHFSYVESGAKHLSELVDDILEYSKLSSPNLKIEKVDARELLEVILIDLSIVIVEKEGTISLGWLPDSIMVDKIKLRQVFQNLISNAIKFTTSGVKPEIDISCKEDETQFTFYVKDNGIGVEEEYGDRIFDPFVRIHDDTSFSGTGIGLTICQRIIRMHKGEMGYTTNEEGGSCFYFTIPK